MISVIIPTLNEEKNIGRCIERVRAEDCECEIIVADGGSTDLTVDVAGRHEGVKIVESGRGRGTQMNRGAAAAAGDILLFLHADTTLEQGWSNAVLSSVGRGRAVAGAFTFRIDNPGRPYRIIELWVSLRCAVFMLPYGDQAIFVKADIFRRLGGYREIPLMEDVDIIDRMKKMGRIVILPEKASTHARRWAREGWVRASLMNNLIMIMYRAGVHPQRLAKMYYRER